MRGYAFETFWLRKNPKLNFPVKVAMSQGRSDRIFEMNQGLRMSNSNLDKIQENLDHNIRKTRRASFRAKVEEGGFNQNKLEALRGSVGSLAEDVGEVAHN